MRIGELRHRINTLRERTRQSDSGGALSEGWARQRNRLAAAKEDVGAGESVQGAQVTPGTQTVFTVRWRRDVLESDRIEHDCNQYEIKGLRDATGKREWLAIDAAKIPTPRLGEIVEGPNVSG